MRRVVLDAGVLIAALISPGGAPAKLLLRWRAGEFDLVVSPRLLAELARVLARPRFRAYISLDDAERYVRFLQRSGTLVEDPPPESGLTPDPGDDYLVSLARAAEAAFLVSGERHLTELEDAVPPVLTPRRFLERLDRT